MSGGCNIYGGFVVGSSSDSSTTSTSWGNITGNISDQKDLTEKLDSKIDKIEGKDLSSNDFTDEEQEKLRKLNTIFTFSLSPDKWDFFNENIYTQTIDFETVKSTDSVIASIALSEDENISQMELECWNKVTKIEISDGSITTYFKGKIPSIPLNIKIKI